MARSTSLLFAALLTVTGGYLDAYTMLTRDVFATGQTGNVILLTVDLSNREWQDALAHLWPILAFLVGVTIASFIKSERGKNASFHPGLVVIAAHAFVLIVIGFLPAEVPNALVTIPIAFIAAVQISMYRQVESLAYISIATTGNLTKLVEGTYATVVDKDEAQRPAVRIYAAIVGAFVGGAVLGAVTTHFLDHRAVWIAALFIAGTFALAYLDERDSRVAAR